MNEELEFNIKPYKNKINSLRDLFNGYSSYRDKNTKEIFIYYHTNKPEQLAWKILLFDVDHECLHEVIQNLTDLDTTIKWDTKIGLETTKFLYEDLFREFQEEIKKNHNGSIKYNEGDRRKTHE